MNMKDLRACMMKKSDIVFFALVLMMVLALSACKTVQQTQERIVTKTDTLWRTQVKHDSIYRHDSIHVREWVKGDTVYRDRDRWHTVYRDRMAHDTVYIARHDTVNVEVMKTEIQRLSWWQRVKNQFADWIIAMLVIALLAVSVWGWLRKRKPLE